MKCKVGVYFPKEGHLKHMFILISKKVSLVIKPSDEFLINFEDYKEDLIKFVCKIEKVVDRNIIIFHDSLTGNVNIFTENTWSLYNLRDKQPQVYKKYREMIDELLKELEDKEYSVTRRDDNITVSKQGIKLILIDLNTFSYILPCKLYEVNRSSLDKIVSCISVIFRTKFIDIYDYIFKKFQQDLNT